MKESNRTRRHRESGLTFAWLLPESSGWALFSATVIAALLALVLFSSLRVRVLPPPRVIERKAEVVLIPSGEEGRAWEIRAQEAGPFPARYTPSDGYSFRNTEETAWANLQTAAAHRPQLHEWPAEPVAIITPAAAKGQRVFPRVDWKPEAPSLPTEDVRHGWDLTLQRLTVLPDDAWPVALPRFDGQLDPATTAVSWRFLVQIGADGRVTQSLMLNSSSDAGGPVLEQWLRGIRFGPSAANAGWIGVGILFNRKP